MSVKVRALLKSKGQAKVKYQRFAFTVEPSKSAQMEEEISQRRAEVRERRISRSAERSSKAPSNTNG
jgi:hypothetical protein